MKKSWQEKLQESKDLPKVVRLKKNLQIRWGGKTMAIPSPLEVDKIMAEVPKGKLISLDLIRQKIAQKHKASIGCPLTCGIFSWIAAHAAEEAREQGKKKITPWWRTVKSDGSLNEKYPGGIQNQARLLRKEDHTIIQKGKKHQVQNFKDSLVKIE